MHTDRSDDERTEQQDSRIYGFGDPQDENIQPVRGGNLSQGFPDFDPPEAVTDRLAQTAKEGPHQYALTWGAPEFQGGPGGKAGAFFRGKSGSGGGDCRNLRQYGGHDGGYAGGDESGG